MILYIYNMDTQLLSYIISRLQKWTNFSSSYNLSVDIYNNLSKNKVCDDSITVGPRWCCSLLQSFIASKKKSTFMALYNANCVRIDKDYRKGRTQFQHIDSWYAVRLWRLSDLVACGRGGRGTAVNVSSSSSRWKQKQFQEILQF